MTVRGCCRFPYSAGIEASREWALVLPGHARAWANVSLYPRRAAALFPFYPCVGHGFGTLLSHHLLLLHLRLAPLALPHSQRCHLLRHQTVPGSAAAMSNWMRSNVSCEQLLRLVEAGQLPLLTSAVEWKVPDNESRPCPPKGFAVSFVAFRERGFSVPARRFIRGVLFECYRCFRLATY
jgi:hypothetical protein